MPAAFHIKRFLLMATVRPDRATMRKVTTEQQQAATMLVEKARDKGTRT
jgi:hypothetical protein